MKRFIYTYGNLQSCLFHPWCPAGLRTLLSHCLVQGSFSASAQLFSFVITVQTLFSSFCLKKPSGHRLIECFQNAQCLLQIKSLCLYFVTDGFLGPWQLVVLHVGFFFFFFVFALMWPITASPHLAGHCNRIPMNTSAQFWGRRGMSRFFSFLLRKMKRLLILDYL